MRLLRSPMLAGVAHGFSTRLGGVSVGRYASLNLSTNWGDDPTRVAENRRLVAEEGGFRPANLLFARQVHGARCLLADGHTAADLAREEADALVATSPGTAVAVLTADCVPILLCDGRGRVAAVHAGWRGTVARIAAAAVDALCAAGAKREDVRAALGPSICPACFEVGEEVAEQFEAAGALPPGVVIREPGRKPHVDLRRANALVLAAAGVPAARVDAAPPCTMCDPDRFFSFRRDGAGIGQMLSFAVAEARES